MALRKRAHVLTFCQKLINCIVCRFSKTFLASATASKHGCLYILHLQLQQKLHDRGHAESQF